MNPKKWPFVNTVFPVILWLGMSCPATAQYPAVGDTSAALKDFIRKIEHAYGNADYLEFRVKYRYANEGQPGQYLDSLSGEVEMDKGRSRTVLAGMETVLNGRYMIQVMPESKAIYLASAPSATVRNPVPMLDSLFAHIEGIQTAVEYRDGSAILTLNLPKGQPYSKLQMRIDDRAGYFQEVEYAVNTASLVGEKMIQSPGHSAPYQARGRIVILFSDYQQGHFDDRLFREDNFFTRVAGRYEPAGRYKDYHIYVTSSNL